MEKTCPSAFLLFSQVLLKIKAKEFCVLVEADDNIALCRYFSLNLFVFQSFSVKPRNRARIFWVASLNQIELLGYFSSNVLIFVYNFPSVTELFKPGPLWVPPAFFSIFIKFFFGNGKDFFYSNWFIFIFIEMIAWLNVFNCFSSSLGLVIFSLSSGCFLH